MSIAVHPLIMRLPEAVDLGGVYPGGAGTIFLAEVMTFGLIAYAAAPTVYHIAQGLVLPWLTQPARRFNGWRFDRKYAAFHAAYGDQSYDQVASDTAERLQRLYVYLSDYPIERDETDTVRFALLHSTRVGNIAATYERYLDTRYGVNAEGYWEHFLFLAPADTRKELDSVQAIASGTLLSAAAGWAVVGICGLLGSARMLHHAAGVDLGPLPVPDVAILWIAVYGISAVILFNYLTRVVHREYGRLFRACVDVHVTDFEGWLDRHQPTMTAERVKAAETFRRYASALVPPDDAWSEPGPGESRECKSNVSASQVNASGAFTSGDGIRASHAAAVQGHTRESQ